jgi:hypothetical protein
MGIYGLWSMLEPAAHTIPISTLCANRVVTDLAFSIASVSASALSNRDHWKGDDNVNDYDDNDGDDVHRDPNNNNNNNNNNNPFLSSSQQQRTQTHHAQQGYIPPQQWLTSLPPPLYLSSTSMSSYYSSSSSSLSSSSSSPPSFLSLGSGQLETIDPDLVTFIKDSRSLFPVESKGLGCHPLKVAVDASIWLMNDRLEGLQDIGGFSVFTMPYHSLLLT